jgi:hypothetical protein
MKITRENSIGMFKKFLKFIKEFHRLIIWITLGVVFILDIFTTTIGLQKGGFEQTPFMISIVNDPILHSIVKILAFCIIFIPIDRFLNHLYVKISTEREKNNRFWYLFVYLVIILTLIWFIGLFLLIVLNNILFIITK